LSIGRFAAGQQQYYLDAVARGRSAGAVAAVHVRSGKFLRAVRWIEVVEPVELTEDRV